MTGIVTCFNAQKGWGFIRPLIGDGPNATEVFFHLSSCRGGVAPPKGSEVSFRLCNGLKGIQAFDVHVHWLSPKVLSRRLQEQASPGEPLKTTAEMLAEKEKESVCKVS